MPPWRDTSALRELGFAEASRSPNSACVGDEISGWSKFATPTSAEKLCCARAGGLAVKKAATRISAADSVVLRRIAVSASAGGRAPRKRPLPRDPHARTAQAPGETSKPDARGSEWASHVRLCPARCRVATLAGRAVVKLGKSRFSTL